MAEENKEQEQVQGEEPAQESEENPQQEAPAREKDGILMPVLYALLAGVGAFTLTLIIGIVLTYFTRPAEPSETPSTGQSSQVTLSPSPTQTPAPTPDGENTDDETGTQAPQEPDGEDTDDETETQTPQDPDGETVDPDAADTPE